MSVDRGGLRYPIFVDDNFSENLTAFRSQINQSRETFRQFRQDLQRGATGNASAGNTRGGSVGSIPGTNVAGGGAGGGGAVPGTAAAAQSISTLTSLSRSFQSVIATVGRAQQSFNNVMASSAKITDRSAFSFQRLFTVVAAFTAIRFITQGFSSLVHEMIDFNSNVEKAELGITGITLEAGNIRDAFGNAVESSRAFVIANAEAKRQVALLRQESVQTNVSFEDLVKTFQNAIGAGLQGGFKIDQIRQLTIGFTQAATALNLAENVAARETRNILTGTVGPSNRLAQLLGISNENIKLAREQGRSYEFLLSKVQAFTEVGQESINTFAGVLARVKNVLAQIVGAGGLEFFNRLKGLLRDTLNIAAGTEDINKKFTLNPQAIEAVRIIGTALEVAIDEAKRLATALGFTGLIDTANTIRTALVATFEIASGLIQGAVQGMNDLTKGAIVVADIFKQITGIDIFDTSKLSSAVALAVRFLTVFLGIAAVSKTFSLILTPLAVVINTLGVQGLVFVAALVGAAAAAQFLASEFFGVDIKLLTLVKIVKETLPGAFQIALNNIRFSFGTLFDGVKIGWLAISDVFQNTVDGLQIGLLKVLGLFSSTAKTMANQLDRLSQQDHDNRVKDIKQTVKDLDAFQQDILKNNEQIKANMQKGVTDALLNNDKTPTIGEFVDQSISNFMDKFKLNLKDVKGETEKWGEVFASLPGIISGSDTALQDTEKTLGKLNDELFQAADALKIGLASLGASGAVLKEREDSLKAEVEFHKQTKKLLADQLNAEIDLKAAQEDRLRTQKLLSEAPEDIKGVVTQGVEIARQIQDLQNRIKTATLESDKALLNSSLDAAKERFNALQNTVPLALQDKTKAIITDLINTEGQEAVAVQKNNDLAKDRQRIETTLNQIVATRITLQAEQNALELTQQNRIAEVQARNARNTFLNQFQIKPTQDLVAAQGQLDLIKAQVAAARDLRQINLDNLNILLAQTKARAADLNLSIHSDAGDPKKLAEDTGKWVDELRAVGALEKQINAFQEQGVTKTEEENTLLDEANLKLEHAKTVAAGGVGALSLGILDGFRQAVQEIPSLYQGVVDTIKGTVEQFASFVSSAITDAFDPTKKVDLVSRFGAFLSGIGKMIIDLLVKIALQKAILGLFGDTLSGLGGLGGAAGGASGLGDFGGATSFFANRGGVVPQAFNAGGFARPAGISSKDTVPAWLTPGEVITPVERAMQVGYDFFERLRRGLIDPSALRAVAGLSRVGGFSRAATGPGFNAGGRVPATAPSAARQGAPMASPAFVVANDQNVERLLAGGKGAMFSFLQGNKGKIRGLLGV